jgi:hypothetical protein
MYNEWNEPLKKWDAHRVKDFFTWAREVYGEEPFKEMIKSYRAVKDVMASVKEPTSLLTAEAITNQALKVLEEELAKAYEYNQP